MKFEQAWDILKTFDANRAIAFLRLAQEFGKICNIPLKDAITSLMSTMKV